MQLEVSTLNILIGSVVALQAWIIREQIGIGRRITRIETAMGLDTTFFKKKKTAKL